MSPKTRSFLRSLLFNVIIPIVLTLIADQGAELVGLGLSPELAYIASLGVGAVLRAYMPDVITART